MNIQTAYNQLLANLYELYGDREAANIANWVTEHVTGMAKIDRITNRDYRLSGEQQQQLQHITTQLLAGRPVQYVLNQAWFGHCTLYVDEQVLIPRPETEELVHWAVRDIRNITPRPADRLCLLDIGTGSGCIAIELKRQLPHYMITAVDKSPFALEVAEKNAAANQTVIEFFQVDILNPDEWQKLPRFDVILSNPPYVKKSEAATMAQHVLEHEPGMALFVPDDDALIFYDAIADFGLSHLAPHGRVYVEINEALGQEVMDLFGRKGYTHVELKQDFQGRDRMVKAYKP